MLSLEQILLYGFIGVVVMRYMSGILADIHATLQLIRYDVKIQKKAGKRLARLTIVVVVRNMEKGVSSYVARTSKLLQKTRNIQVLIVDNASTDKTLTLARKAATAHKNITVYGRRKHTKTNRELLKIIRRQAKGSVFMLTTPSTHVTRQLLVRAQKLFAAAPKTELVRPLSLLHKPKNLGQVLVIFNTISQKRFSKLVGVQDNDLATTLFLRKRSLKTSGVIAASTDHTMPQGYLTVHHKFGAAQNEGWLPKTPAAKSRATSAARRGYRLFSSVVYNLEPYVYAYMLFLAITYNRPDMLLVAWSLVTGAYAYSLFTTNFYSFTHKFRLSLYVPILFVVAIFASCANHVKTVFLYIRSRIHSHQTQRTVSA